ncbi:hypothetical protein B7494_g8217 [Chlorociboria aeruginascens]|nr:hypothetical protein B7494_g8217 [Chlorociboria aeruginascens]
MMPQHQLQFLQGSLRLTPTPPDTEAMLELREKGALSDLVFISLSVSKHQGIDYDFHHSPNFEIGLSILDDRDISTTLSQTSIDFNPITNHHFVVTSLPHIVQQSDQHLFGQPIFYKDSCDLFDAIRPYLYNQRNVVLVIQNPDTITFLESQGLSIPQDYGIATLDLSAIASCYFHNISSKSSVRKVLKALGHEISPSNPPIAVTDSYLTMKALLKLAMVDYPNAKQSLEVEETARSKEIINVIASGRFNLAFRGSAFWRVQVRREITREKRRRQLFAQLNKRSRKKSAGSRVQKRQARDPKDNVRRNRDLGMRGPRDGIRGLESALENMLLGPSAGE